MKTDGDDDDVADDDDENGGDDNDGNGDADHYDDDDDDGDDADNDDADDDDDGDADDGGNDDDDVDGDEHDDDDDNVLRAKKHDGAHGNKFGHVRQLPCLDTFDTGRCKFTSQKSRSHVARSFVWTRPIDWKWIWPGGPRSC